MQVADDDGGTVSLVQTAPQILRPFGSEGPTVVIGGGRIDGVHRDGLVMVENLQGGIHYHPATPEPRRAVPRQISAPPPLQGHEREREELAGLVATAGALVLLCGASAADRDRLAAGVLCALDAPGGHLYAELGADAPDGPAAPSSVLAQLLGTVGSEVPDSLSERAALWRTETSHRPVTLLLADAVSAAQARALRPGGASVTVVTSSVRLSGLVMDGASLVLLDPHREDELA